MKKALIIMIVTLSFISNSYAGDITITLANGEWAPYLSKNLVHEGFVSHVVKRAFGISNVDVEYKWYDNFWKRAYKDARDGIVNGSLVWSKKPEREVEMFYSQPVFDGKRDVFFFLKGSGFDWNSYKDLRGKILGGTIGYNYGEAFDEAEKWDIFRVVRVKNDHLNFKVLLMGRIDAFVAGETAGYKVLNENFTREEVERVRIHDKPVRVSTYHLILSRQIFENRDVLARFNYGLQQLKESGEYDKMLKNFKEGYYSKKKE